MKLNPKGGFVMAGGIISDLIDMFFGKFLKQVLNENVSIDPQGGIKFKAPGAGSVPVIGSDLQAPKEPPHGTLPAGLYAMLDIGEGFYSVLILSKDFKGDVAISTQSGSETIKAEPGTWKSGKSMPLLKGMAVNVAAGGLTQALTTNYPSFQAIDYGVHTPAGHVIGAGTVFGAGNTRAGRKITGVYCISENQGEMYNNPSDPAVAWFAVSASEKVVFDGGPEIDMLKKSGLIQGKTYFLYAHYFDEGMNFLGGIGGEKVVYQ
jgi:hypothetical protein